MTDLPSRRTVEAQHGVSLVVQQLHEADREPGDIRIWSGTRVVCDLTLEQVLAFAGAAVRVSYSDPRLNMPARRVPA